MVSRAATPAAHPGALLLAAISHPPGSVTTTTGTPNFIVPNGTFFAELIVFVAVFGVVARFILPPIKAAMDERDRLIASALEMSGDARAEAARLEQESLVVLAAARAEARQLLEDAGSKVGALLEEARAKGQEEHDRILAAATPMIAAERRRLADELSGRLEDLSVAAASRVLGSEIDLNQHGAAILEAIASVRAGHGA